MNIYWGTRRSVERWLRRLDKCNQWTTKLRRWQIHFVTDTDKLQKYASIFRDEDWGSMFVILHSSSLKMEAYCCYETILFRIPRGVTTSKTNMTMFTATITCISHSVICSPESQMISNDDAGFKSDSNCILLHRTPTTWNRSCFVVKLTELEVQRVKWRPGSLAVTGTSVWQSL